MEAAEVGRVLVVLHGLSFTLSGGLFTPLEWGGKQGLLGHVFRLLLKKCIQLNILNHKLGAATDKMCPPNCCNSGS